MGVNDTTKENDLFQRIDYSYLRPKKADMVKGFHNEKLEKRNDISAKEYSNATILPLRKDVNAKIPWQGLGGVVDSNGEYVEHSKVSKLIDQGYSPESTMYCNKTVVYCGYFRRHWGEFIAYCLPRLWYVLLNDPSVNEYVFFIEENEQFELSGNYKLMIERLGILDKVSFISTPTTYEKVIVPELCYIQSKYYSTQYIDIFNLIHSNIEHVITQKANKIFLTRSQLTKSRAMESGVDMLDNFFVKNGFKVISPETVSLDEMVMYMDNADIIACISGTLPHNLLFAYEQAISKKLIILERNALFNFFQPDTDKMLNCEITFIDANISLYPVELSYGPFIFAWNDYLKRFADNNQMIIPDAYYLDEKYKKNLLKEYMRAYRFEHHKCLYMPSWMQKYVNVIFEAYYDGEEYFGEYLREQKPYLTSQKPPFAYFVRLIRKIFKE